MSDLALVKMTISADSTISVYPLFQRGDGGLSPTSALQFYISRVSHRIAKDFIERWHYSHKLPTGLNICYGLWYGDELYAVIVYGLGVNPYQSEFLGVQQAVEIKRMVRSEPKLADYPLSRFIGLTAKFLRAEIFYDCIVAFADPEHGHEGTVYKAAGFTLHGQTNAEWHTVDKHGNKRHRRFAFRHARRNDITIAESRDVLELSRVQTEPKLRWVRMI